MKCPVCDADLTEEQQTDDYETFVADDDGSCIEFSDAINSYRCTNDHRIYIGQD